MSYYRIRHRTIVFDHLEKTSVTKTWKHVEPGTLIMVTKQPVQQRAEFVVIEGPAADYRGEAWLFDATPLSALEILAMEAE